MAGRMGIIYKYVNPLDSGDWSFRSVVLQTLESSGFRGLVGLMCIFYKHLNPPDSGGGCFVRVFYKHLNPPDSGGWLAVCASFTNI